MRDMKAMAEAATEFATVVLREYPQAAQTGLGMAVRANGTDYTVTFGPMPLSPGEETVFAEQEDPQEDPGDHADPGSSDTPVSPGDQEPHTPVSDRTDA